MTKRPVRKNVNDCEPIPAVVTESAVTLAQVNLEPSTFADGGFRKWADGRDSEGRTFAEWAVACVAISSGQEPQKPSQPRFRGLFPPGPRRQPEASEPDAPKTITVIGKPISRLDAYARKPSRKSQKKKSEANGATYIRSKDIRVLEEILSWGMLTRNQLAGLLGLAPNSLVRRLKKLVAIGLLTKGHSLSGVFLYSVSTAGRRILAAEKWPTPQQSLLRYDHTQACIEIAIWVQGQSPAAVVVSEREIQHASYDPEGRIASGGDLGPRLKRVAPWLQEQASNDFSLWSPRVFNSVGGTVGRKRPDLLVAQKGKAPLVIEIELHEKRPKEYAQMMIAYAEAQARGNIGRVIYFVSPDAALSEKRLRNLFAKAQKMVHLPQGISAKIDIRAIPSTIWSPLAAQLKH